MLDLEWVEFEINFLMQYSYYMDVACEFFNE